MVKLAINWQNFAQVGLQVEFAFRIRLLKLPVYPTVFDSSRQVVTCYYHSKPQSLQ